MKLICIRLSQEQYESLADLVKKGLYPTKTEAIKIAIRDLILKEKGKD